MNKRLIIACMTVVFGVFFLEAKSNVEMALARVKVKHHIQKEDDYIAAAVNRTTIFDKKIIVAAMITIC